MTKKNIFIIAATILAVAGFYLYLFKDSFRKPVIQISYMVRPKATAMVRPSGGDSINNLTFALGSAYKLTHIKVVNAANYATNQYAPALWELITKSNSIPLRAFAYGERIHGMQPPVKGQQPDPLEPNVQYRLLVESGKLKGEHEFTITDDSNLAH